MIGANTAFVIAEDHIHHPVQAILYRPMAADDRPERMRQPHQGRYVKARLALDLVGDFARALDHDDALQSRPIVALLQPSEIMDCGVGYGLDATLFAVHSLLANVDC